MKQTILKKFKNRLIPITYHNIIFQPKKISKEKAYVFGVLCGDGWIWCKPKWTYQIGLETIDEDFANEFRKSMFLVYGINPKKNKRFSKVKNWSNKFVIRLCSKLVYDDLINYQTFKTKEWKVPKELYHSNLEIKSYFLRGLFDSEGSVDKITRRITLTSSNFKSLKEIKNILINYFNIRVCMETVTKKNIYVLKIQDRRSIELFNEKIGFTIKRKNNKILDIIKSYKLYITPHKISIKLKPEVLRLRKNGYSYLEISKKTKLSLATISNYVNSRFKPIRISRK